VGVAMGRRRSRSPRLEKPPHQRHDGDRRHDDHQKRHDAKRDAENQEGECCKHGCHHNDRDRSDDPGTTLNLGNRERLALTGNFI
jgi:hypothetical protein